MYDEDVNEEVHPFAKFDSKEFPEPFFGPILPPTPSDQDDEISEYMLQRFVYKATRSGILIEHRSPITDPWYLYNQNGFWPSDIVWFAESKRLADLLREGIPESPIAYKVMFTRRVNSSPIHLLSQLMKDESSATDSELTAIRAKHNITTDISLPFGNTRCIHEDIRFSEYAAVSIDFDIEEEMWFLQVWYSEDFDKDSPSNEYLLPSFEALLAQKQKFSMDWPDEEIRKRFIEADPRWEKFLG